MTFGGPDSQDKPNNRGERSGLVGCVCCNLPPVAATTTINEKRINHE